MELIDKQQILELLDEEIHVYSLEDGILPEFDKGVLYLANKLKAVINLHTLDACTAQEREPTVAQLKQYIECRADRDDWKTRAKQAEQAEQERDEARAMISQSNSVVEMMLLERERNALLEGLKWYADNERYQLTVPVRNYRRFESVIQEDKGARARSIIAKLEGSKPE
jgi:hypothetical protein